MNKIIKLSLLIIILSSGFSFCQSNLAKPDHYKNNGLYRNAFWIPYNRSINNSYQTVSAHPKLPLIYNYNSNKLIKNRNQLKPFVYNSANADLADWQKLSGPYGGDVRRFYKFNDTLYAITDMEIYKYVNNSWVSLNFEKNVWSWMIYCMYKYDSGRIIVGCDEGLYYTDDEGMNWNLVQSDLMGTIVRDILKMNNNDMFLSTAKGIYFSQNNELNFKLFGLDSLHVQTVSVDASGDIWAGTDQDVYMAKYYSSNPNYLSYNKKRDNGRNIYPSLKWQKMNFPVDYYEQIIFDSKGVVYTYASYNNTVYRSFNSGGTWDYLQLPFVSNINLYHDQLFVTGMYNLLIYNDTGLQWESTKSDIFLLNTFFADSSEMYVGTLGAGALKFNMLQNRFTSLSVGLNASSIRSVTPMQNGNLLASTDADSFYVSTDKGLSWKSTQNFFSLLVKSGKDGTIYSAANSGLIKSQNYGATWDTLNIDVYPYFISAFDVSDDDKTICAGTSTGEVYVSNDGGENFVKIKKSNYVFVDGVKILNDKTFLIYNDSLYYTNDGGKSLVSIKDSLIWGVHDIIRDQAGYIYISSNGGLFRSLDGRNWTQLHIPPPGAYYIRLDKYDNLYAASYDGVIQVSTDHGMNWEILSNNVMDSFACSFALDDEGYFYLGTQNMGLFRTKIELKKKTISSYLLSNNFPNPFNPSTTIQFDIPSSSFVTLKIYNILGQEIQTLVSGYMQSGSYFVNWDASKYASGVYIYMLQTGNFSEAKKMLLLK